MSKLSSEEFCVGLRELRMLHERVNNYQEFMTHEQTKAMGTLYWYDYPGIGNLPIANLPGMDRLGNDPNMLHAPELGEHTEMVLSEIGYSKKEIRALESTDAINTKQAKQAG